MVLISKECEINNKRLFFFLKNANNLANNFKLQLLNAHLES